MSRTTASSANLDHDDAKLQIITYQATLEAGRARKRSHDEDDSNHSLKPKIFRNDPAILVVANDLAASSAALVGGEASMNVTENKHIRGWKLEKTHEGDDSHYNLKSKKIIL